MFYIVYMSIFLYFLGGAVGRGGAICTCTYGFHVSFTVFTWFSHVLRYVYWLICVYAYMRICVCVYIYIYMHLHFFTWCVYASRRLRIYASMHLCIYASMPLRVDASIYASMHLCIYASMHLCIYACIRTYASMHLCIYAFAHLCVYAWLREMLMVIFVHSYVYMFDMCLVWVSNVLPIQCSYDVHMCAHMLLVSCSHGFHMVCIGFSYDVHMVPIRFAYGFHITELQKNGRTCTKDVRHTIRMIQTWRNSDPHRDFNIALNDQMLKPWFKHGSTVIRIHPDLIKLVTHDPNVAQLVTNATPKPSKPNFNRDPNTVQERPKARLKNEPDIIQILDSLHMNLYCLCVLQFLLSLRVLCALYFLHSQYSPHVP